jgi:putative membrane protein
MDNLFLRWAVLCLAVFVAANVSFLGIGYDSWAALIVAALMLGVVNSIVKPILMFLTFPFILVSFGIFILFINAWLFYLVGFLVKGFHVDSFGSALGGSIVVSLVNLLLSTGHTTIKIERRERAWRSDRIIRL